MGMTCGAWRARAATAVGLALLAFGAGSLAAQEGAGAAGPRAGADCGPEMSAREAVWIVGTVQDAGAEVRLPGAGVTMTWQAEEGVRTRSTATDGEGVYRFCGLQPGVRVTLRATVADRSGVSVPLEVPAGETTVRQDLGVLLSEGEDGRIMGRVIDRETGAGVEAARVRLAPNGPDAVTDRQGRFVLQAVPSGERALELRHVAYGEHETEVEVQEGRTADVTIAVSETPVEMEALEVTVRQRENYLERRGFYERQRWADARGGLYLTPEDLERRQAGRLSHVVGAAQGVKMQQICTGGTCGAVPYIARVPITFPDDPCRTGAVVYVDGVKTSLWDRCTRAGQQCPVKGYQVRGKGLDDITMSDVSAVEIYRGASELPAEFGGSDARCGVIAIWTKMGPDRREEGG